VAALCLHVLGVAAFPDTVTGVRLYESGIDEDGLACYRLRAGQMDRTADWYGTFWRTYWYDTFTKRISTARMEEPAPDLADQLSLFRKLDPLVTQLVERTADLARLSRRRPLPVERLKSAQAHVSASRQRALDMALPSPAFGPTAVALLRELHNGDAMELSSMAIQQATTYRTWSERMRSVMDRLDAWQAIQTNGTRSSTSTRIPLLMP
jgi:hypothetical protein